MAQATIRAMTQTTPTKLRPLHDRVLVKRIEEQDDKRRRELFESLRGGSIIAWAHINLLGEYDFSDEKLQDSVGLEIPQIRELRVP